MDLSKFDNRGFDRGKSRFMESVWLVISVAVASSVPGSSWRAAFLRAFGAQIGEGVVIKPRLRVKFPWRLTIGKYSWIGEDVWIDNLAQVTIGTNSCVSQSAYFCTGSHDWTDPTFRLITKPITVEDQVWIAARAIVGPGVRLREGAVLGLGSVANRDLDPWAIYSGAPAARVRDRRMSDRTWTVPPQP